MRDGRAGLGHPPRQGGGVSARGSRGGFYKDLNGELGTGVLVIVISVQVWGKYMSDHFYYRVGAKSRQR